MSLSYVSYYRSRFATVEPHVDVSTSEGEKTPLKPKLQNSDQKTFRKRVLHVSGTAYEGTILCLVTRSAANLVTMVQLYHEIPEPESIIGLQLHFYQCMAYQISTILLAATLLLVVLWDWKSKCCEQTRSGPADGIRARSKGIVIASLVVLSVMMVLLFLAENEYNDVKDYIKKAAKHFEVENGSPISAPKATVSKRKFVSVFFSDLSQR